MRYNNRDDLLQLKLHFENFNIFGGLYSFITQSNIHDGVFIAKIVSR